MFSRTVVTVSQLNQYVKSVFEADHILNGIMVSGEISNFVRHYKSGHLYFTLKDDSAAIKAVMFRGNASALRFEPENGMSVIVSGSVSLYERDGSYQFYVTDMQPDGVGALHLAYEQLKDKLEREGLFDQQRKRPLPKYPERIGIVTSEGAAALQDMLNILSRRYPIATVVLYPAMVQGEGAADTVAEGIRALNNRHACDVIIIGRGGGSLEDLWAFNDEKLARTIASSDIPIISAVGHETDFTIADFAADLRAPTPSAAAEQVSPNLSDLRYYLADMENQCGAAINRKLESLALRLQSVKAMLATPETVLAGYSQKIVYLQETIEKEIRHRLQDARQRVSHLSELIEAKSPLKLLSQGYSLTFLNEENLHSAAQAAIGDQITTRLSDGALVSTVTEIKEYRQ